MYIEAGVRQATVFIYLFIYLFIDLCCLYINLLHYLFKQPAQFRFLRDCNVDEKDALLHFNLAPLTMRRDIAMLGLIHQTVLGKGPPRFKEYFKRDPSAKLRRHCNHLVELPVGQLVSVVERSALGLIGVYNLLPADAAKQTTVANLQRAIQNLVKDFFYAGGAEGGQTHCPQGVP